MQAVLGKIILGVAAVAFAAATSSASAQPASAGMGSWKLNVAKSKYSPGPGYQSLTAKFEPVGKGVKVTTEGINADGSKTSQEYTANYDGKDVPLKGSPIADTMSLVRKDAHTTVRTDKKAGKVVTTLTRVVARDGKSFTVAVVGTNAKGEAVKNDLLFEKQ